MIGASWTPTSQLFGGGASAPGALSVDRVRDLLHSRYKVGKKCEKVCVFPTVAIVKGSSHQGCASLKKCCSSVLCDFQGLS